MGGGGSHHVEYVQVPYVPPQVQQQLDDQANKLKQFEEEAKKKSDPKHYKENASQLLKNFVAGLDKLELTESIKKNPGEIHIGVIGPISSGKTTLINTMFNTKLPTTLGHNTEGCKVVYAKDNMVVWDLMGVNDDYKFYDAESLSFIKSLDVCLVLFDNDIKMVSSILLTIHKLNPAGLVIIRTKVDQWNPNNARTVYEERTIDSYNASELLNDKIDTYCISSLNVDKTMNGGVEKIYDWDIIKQKLTVHS
jgi:GTPase SAR1 family protein